MGLQFANPVGLAAGLDKNADHLDALGALGFGFVEVGTVTPRPQPGNPKPRMFRLPEHQAIINRLGFNNKGVDHLVAQVERSRYDGIIGINIGKNKDTPNEQALDDYLICLEKAYAAADYITINISSPNTANLRDLQALEPLRELLSGILNRRDELANDLGERKPVALKLAPDMADDQTEAIAQLLNQLQPDGVIATNTTIDRKAVSGHKYANEAGGLSGSPVKQSANHTLALLHQHLDASIARIGVGGITCQADAAEKFANGADLVQIYTGFIYQGPDLIDACIAAAA